MIKTKVRYNGIAKDSRSKKEIAKDFQAKELLVYSPKLFRNITSFSEMRKGVIRNQNGSGSCVTQALAKAIEMNIEKQELSHVLSATYPYQNRSNRPQSGSSPQEMAQFTRSNGFYLESDVPSQNMNDASMDGFVIPQTKQKKQGYQVYYFVDTSPNFEETAQYVEEFGNATMLVDCDYNGYVKDIPTPNSRNHQIRHQICAVDNITLNNTQYIVIDDSWGIFGDSELAKRGQRLITKDAFNKMVEQVLVMRVMKVEKGNVDYSKYTNLPYMEYGHRNAEILRLQEMLKETGHLPKDLDTVNIDKYGKKYGYYGTITNNAVLKWQLENIKTVSEKQLKAWGGKYFGNASLQTIKNLSNGNGDNTPQENMQKIQFKWDKFLTITGSALLLYIATNINNIEWTKAGLISAGTALIQFLAQAILKYINEEKG